MLEYACDVPVRWVLLHGSVYTGPSDQAPISMARELANSLGQPYRPLGQQKFFPKSFWYYSDIIQMVEI